MRRDGNFLQGLYYDDDREQFVESAGLYGESKVQWLDEVTDDDDGRILEPDTSTQDELAAQYFGEGLSPRSASEFIVLTWREGKMFTLDRTSLEEQAEFELPSGIAEGWGVTADETNVSDDGNYRLYVSDGSSSIFVLDGDTLTLQPDSTVTVKEGNTERDNINELEYVDGYIYANVWYQDELLKIDPSNGAVVKKWDISSLAAAERKFQKAWKNGSTT